MALTPHEVLTDTIIELCLSTSPKVRASAIPQNGLFLQKFDFQFDYKVFKEEYDNIFCEKCRVPDGVLQNKLKRRSITFECKSDVKYEDRFLKQLRFFSENKAFKKVFKIGKLNEILVVCLEDISTSTINAAKKLNIDTNIVIWSVDMETYASNKFFTKQIVKRDDKFCIKKIYGEHSDTYLDAELAKGILVNPPANHFLTDNNVRTSELVAEVAERIRSVINIVEELDLQDFVKNMNDVFVSTKRIREAIILANNKIPELGQMTADGKKLIFPKKANHQKIQARIEEVKKMDKATLMRLQERLKKISKQATMYDYV